MPKPQDSHDLDMLKSSQLEHVKRNQFLTPSFPNPPETANIPGLKRDFPPFKGFRAHLGHTQSSGVPCAPSQALNAAPDWGKSGKIWKSET